MSTDMILEIDSTSYKDTLNLGKQIGKKLKGGELIELEGDLGSGKTVFVRGLAAGLNSKDQVASPTFTISRIYKAKKADIEHYDFYRLNDAGIIRSALEEAIKNPRVAVVIEWSSVVKSSLPTDRLQIKFVTTSPESRKLKLIAGEGHQHLVQGLKK